MSKREEGFTLIELLIVVAIIAILAMIAVPNFLEAQTRSKVSRVKADMRSIITALEAYAVDHNEYPHMRLGYELGMQYNRGAIYRCTSLTTPVAYLTTTMIRDPFGTQYGFSEAGDRLGTDDGVTIHYINIGLYRRQSNLPQNVGIAWGLGSLGPDYKKGPDARTGGNWNWGNYGRDNPIDKTDPRFTLWQYDPTNGTVSSGDILRFQ